MSGKGTAISRYRSQRTADPARTFFKDDKCGNVEAAGVSKNNCIHKPEPILHVRKRFVTYKEAAELYSMGLTRIQEHTKMAGATYKMGNKVLVNTDIFEAYLEQYRIPGDYEGMAKKFTPDLVELYR